METKLLNLGKPDWLKIRPPKEKYHNVKNIISDYSLHTVCQEAHCPNISECWSGGTATFMVLGDICTRGCRFCAVKKGKPGKVDLDEPRKLAKAVKEMGIFDYIVITSVDRDDLIDQGSMHFASCIREVKSAVPGIKVEVLTPDFQGSEELISNVLNSEPDVFAQNIETVKRLQDIRDKRAGYNQTLDVLGFAKKHSPGILTKSSLMLGLGEKDEEVIETMKDLRKNHVDIITFGQYLKPKNRKLEVKEFVTPEKFKYFQEQAYFIGFKYCASGPFVRSSYRAGEWVKRK